jgi:DNA-binding SARP family transcriptional activator
MQEQPVLFRVLSAVNVRSGGTIVKIAAPRQRALLAQLLVNANQTVSASKLIDGIWGGVPPQHPEAALQVVVCRLRGALDVISPRVVRESPGYRIELEPDELDLMRAQSHVVEADRRMQAGDPAGAASMYDAALACWTGEPLADVANFPFYDSTAQHLRKLRIGMVESRNAAYLRCGRHLDVLRDIETWIETEPWRERLRAHQMVALYRSGRQIEALAVYEDVRRLLVNEFGVDPHDDLKRLHGRILRRDPMLLANRGEVQPRETIALDRSEVVRVAVRPAV